MEVKSSHVSGNFEKLKFPSGILIFQFQFLKKIFKNKNTVHVAFNSNKYSDIGACLVITQKVLRLKWQNNSTNIYWAAPVCRRYGRSWK